MTQRTLFHILNKVVGVAVLAFGIPRFIQELGQAVYFVTLQRQFSETGWAATILVPSYSVGMMSVVGMHLLYSGTLAERLSFGEKQCRNCDAASKLRSVIAARSTTGIHRQ